MFASGVKEPASYGDRFRLPQDQGGVLLGFAGGHLRTLPAMNPDKKNSAHETKVSNSLVL
jgi:hypothetical protein